MRSSLSLAAVLAGIRGLEGVHGGGASVGVVTVIRELLGCSVLSPHFIDEQWLSTQGHSALSDQVQPSKGHSE